MGGSLSPGNSGTGLQEENQYDSMISVDTPDGNEAPTISERCKECIEHYHLLCDGLEECTTEQAANLGFDKILAFTRTEDARSRFKAWATNIAALQKPSLKSSLDFRLSEATEIRRMILSILADLKESLSKSVKIVLGEVPNERWKLGVVSDSEEEDLISGGSEDDTVETCDLEQLLEAIEASSTSLMKLSMIIRNSPSRDDYLKAASRYSSYPADWDIKHVQEKHGKAKGSRDWLIERLGKAITRRRQYLMYRREHHDKLSRDYDTASHKKDDERTNALTKATTFVENKVIDDRDGSDIAGSFGSQTSYEPTMMGEQAQLATELTVPPQPRMADEGVPFKFGEVFTCPYCWTPQVVKNKLAWKKHVFHDLKPYVCTFKPCNLRMFRSRNEWFAHELQNHRREWRCHLCSELYNSESSLSSHLSSKHASAAAGVQLQALILKSEEPVDRVSSSACMLCDEWEAKITNPNQDARRAFLNQGQSVKPYGTLRLFRRHLGRHMEQLALFALPTNEADQGEDERSDANQSSHTSDLAQVQNWRQGSVESSASGSDKASVDDDSTHEVLASAGEPQTIPDLSQESQLARSLDIRNKLTTSGQTHKHEESGDSSPAVPSEFNPANALSSPQLLSLEARSPEEDELKETDKEPEKHKLYSTKEELQAYYHLEALIEARKYADELKILNEKYRAEKEKHEDKAKEQKEEEYQHRLEEDLRKSGLNERQIESVVKKEKEVESNRPTYTRMSRKHLSIETLNRYRLDYEVDVASIDLGDRFRQKANSTNQDPEYVLIKRWVPEYEQDFLWNHTREIRAQREHVIPAAESRY